MRFKINLATKVYIDTRLLKLCTSATILLLGILLFYTARNSAVTAQEIKRLAKEITAADDRTKSAVKGVSEKEYRVLLDRIGFANAVIEKKTYNWLALLDRLEQVVPDGVAITSIEPDPKSQGLKLSGTTRSFNNLRTFMEHLEDSNFFTDVYLTNQGESKLGDVKLGNAMQLVTFDLTCKVIRK